MTSTTATSALTIAEQDIFVTSAEWYTQSNAPEFIHRESEAQLQHEAKSQSNDAEYDISQDRQFQKFLRRFGGNRKSCK
ncbi:hypothetical protein BGZ91_004777 [Linnemannia elongata]|nr:hypothetical protein BGZ91_004777 [Linnemannia elongata]